MKRTHLILTGLSATIVLLSLNRLTPFTQTLLQPYDYLRWMDLLAMIPIPLASVILYYLLKNEIVKDSLLRKTTLYVVLNLFLITGIYLFAAGSGTHEFANYLHFKFCRADITSALCKIIIYNDDQFSHYVYYIGFILLNISLMFLEYFVPRSKDVSQKNLFFITLNSLVIALGIFANLAFEEAFLDLFFFGVVMLLSLYLLFKDRKKVFRLPVLYYFASSYTVGIVSTIVYKLATGTPF
ncbi:hypothetical protein HY407_05360 [Candidatus Gottesmanbacteria bacterium]|nr:hypothetical protein [Candidatus Gottesmanbacteria bacterium]